MRKKVTRIEHKVIDGKNYYLLFGDNELILDAKEGHLVFLNRSPHGAAYFQHKVEDVRVGDVLRSLGDIHR